MQISNRTRLYEIIAVSLTGIGKIVFINLIDLRLPYIIIMIVGWLGGVFFYTVLGRNPWLEAFG